VKHSLKNLTKLHKTEALKRSRFSRANLAVFALIFVGVGGFLIYSSFAAGLPSTLHVSGSQLVDSNNNIVKIHGADRSGTEYACIQGWGIFDGGDTATNDDSQPPLMASWGINSEFVGLNEDCWLGINGVPSQYGGANYQNAIKHYVQTIENNGMYPVVNLFWSAPGTQQATDLSIATMPDNDHSALFWQQVATAFKDDPRVMFRLAEEPHPNGNGNDLNTWKCWSKGDRQYDTSNTLVPISQNTNCSEGFPVVGMQSLINIVRGTGASNIIQVPGIQYANAMSCGTNIAPTTCGFLDSANGVRVHDTLSPEQLIADVDVYPTGNACGNVSCYNTEYAPVANVMPFVAGETGFGDAADITFIDWMDSHTTGYYAWAWDTWAQLLSDYNGTPASPWGTYYKSHIASISNPLPSIAISANPTKVTSGGSSTITWTSSNTTSCSAASPAGWTSSTATSGSQVINNITTTTTYTLSCTGPNGTNSASTTISITDAIPPTVSITAPSNGATVSGCTVNVTANASDNVGVTGVQFKLDGSNLGSEDSTSPYSVAWDSVSATNGTHTLTAVAHDADSNSTTSATITVTVSNQASGVAGLVAAYNFDAGSGSTLTDNSGHCNNGAINGASWNAGGKNSGALSFNGTSNSVSIPDSSSLRLTNGMTLEAWVKPSIVDNTWRTILFKVQSQAQAQSYDLISGSDHPGPGVQINTTGEHTTYGTQLSANTWSHVAGTYDGTTLQFYVNGTSVASSAASGNMGEDGGALLIGNSFWNEYFSGLIDDVRIYNKALTAAQITSDMNTAVGSSSSDTTAPTVSLTAPTAGATVSGNITVSANASDNVGVSGVQFKLDGNNLQSEDITSPYSISWDSTTTANGTHTLTAVARDAAGNTTTSSPISITTSNTVTPKQGDINGDNSVNITDLSLLLSSYGQNTTQCITNSAFKCDLSSPADGVVNIFDLSILLSHYGT
jgi:hypothetical protein